MNEKQQKILKQIQALPTSPTPSEIAIIQSDVQDYFNEVNVQLDTVNTQLQTVNEKYTKAVTMNGELLQRVPIGKIGDEEQKMQNESDETITDLDFAKQYVKGDEK